MSVFMKLLISLSLLYTPIKAIWSVTFQDYNMCSLLSQAINFHILTLPCFFMCKNTTFVNVSPLFFYSTLILLDKLNELSKRWKPLPASYIKTRSHQRRINNAMDTTTSTPNTDQLISFTWYTYPMPIL
jgi:hypothetical protein